MSPADILAARCPVCYQPAGKGCRGILSGEPLGPDAGGIWPKGKKALHHTERAFEAAKQNAPG